MRCAEATIDALRGIGLEVRADLHHGEVERDGDHPRGIAVAVGARIAALGRSGEVLVSSTVAEVVRGSGISFEPRGAQQLNGIGEWAVFAVSWIDGQAPHRLP